MRKRSGRSSSSSSPEASRTLNSKTGDVADETRKEDGGFFACYLLVSLNPRHKSHTYIGFTVNPRRRIRQHNGEITCGAGRTKKKRPWEMALCIYGFPTNVAALQFEWAWQHPTESVAVRNAAASFKSLSGIANKIKLAYTMLTLPAWQGLNLTVNFFSTKYTKHSAACPSLPERMKVRVCPMDDLPCYGQSNHNLWENEDEDEDDWNDDNEFEKNGGTGGYVQEQLVNAAPYHPADHHNIMVSENFGESEENVLRKPRELITLEDQEDYLCSGGSPGKVNSSTCPGLYASEESIRDRQDIRKSELNSFELECPDGKLLQVSANDRQLLSSCTVSREVEVIDISTPSPDCRIDIFTKKRRISDPQIIDLTKSPMFVQL